MSRDPFEFDDEATVVPGLGGQKDGGCAPQAPEPPAAPPAATPTPPPASDAVLGGAATPQAGAPAAPAATPQPRRSLAPQATTAAPIDGPLETLGPTPLMNASAELLLEAGVKSQMAVHPDPAGFRRQCETMLQRFHTRARQAGTGEEELQLASFILTSLVDDVVMATPWGVQAGWGATSLSASVHSRTDGGERVYQIAEKLIAEPGRHPQVLGLLHATLCAGFQGQHRNRPDGRALVDDTRERVFRAYEQVRPRAEGELSPRWRGSSKGHTPILSSTPLWVFAAGFGVLALIIYAGLLFDLARRGNVAITPLTQAATPTIVAQEQTPPPPPARNDPFDQIESILQPDIYSGRAKVENYPSAVLITLQSTEAGELFRSGGHEPSGAYGATLQRVAEAAELTNGTVLVEGHTDNQPIRSLRYGGSNVRLSEERAQSVADRVGGYLDPNRDIETRGYGADRPLKGVDQATPEGRRLNRRVDIVLSKR